MKKKTFVFIGVVIVVLAIVFGVNYFYNRIVISEKNPIKVTDSEGKEVTLTKVPEKIITLIPSATEVVYGLDMGDKVIAVDSYSNYPVDALNKEILETGTNLNIEKIMALNPDVIFMSKMGQTIEQYNMLVESGVTVVIVDAKSISQTYDSIMLIGKVLNKNKEAEKMVLDMKNDLAAISKSVEGKEPKSLYYEISPLQYGLWTGGKDTFENELIEIVGAKNVFSDIGGWSQISEEQVLSRNPDYIITTVKDYGNGNPVDEILSRGNWDNINAVINKKVYTINPDVLSRPTPRLVEGAEELVKILYGE